LVLKKRSWGGLFVSELKGQSGGFTPVINLNAFASRIWTLKAKVLSFLYISGGLILGLMDCLIIAPAAIPFQNSM
jgi:hypothetical protein